MCAAYTAQPCSHTVGWRTAQPCLGSATPHDRSRDETQIWQVILGLASYVVFFRECFEPGMRAEAAAIRAIPTGLAGAALRAAGTFTLFWFMLVHKRKHRWLQTWV